MNAVKAVCDSLNLSSLSMESIFIHHANYTIEAVKTKSIFYPTIWSQTFGKSLQKNIIEAKIIHTHLGIKLPLKTFAITPKRQTVEFAGLHGYNERSHLLTLILRELWTQLQYTRITRLDIAIDFKGKIPQKVLANLNQTRKPFKYKNTVYYKTEKEKSRNQKMDIKVYNKQKQAKLAYSLYRLEFVFKGNYFNKLLLKDIQLIYKRMEKSIKRATGLEVKIVDICPLG